MINVKKKIISSDSVCLRLRFAVYDASASTFAIKLNTEYAIRPVIRQHTRKLYEDSKCSTQPNVRYRTMKVNYV